MSTAIAVTAAPPAGTSPVRGSRIKEGCTIVQTDPQDPTRVLRAVVVTEVCTVGNLVYITGKDAGNGQVVRLSSTPVQYWRVVRV